ncbi:MAG: group 1 truncated hemoglobin [Rhodospirillaceae bacterium]|nr:group 1 truncated hemoglobin [Rhodospirillaceae bacterium]
MRLINGRRRFLIAMACMTAARVIPARAAADPLADFGGRDGIKAIVDDLELNYMSDARLRPFFANVDRKRISQQLTIQFCSLLGGGCEYTGANMKGVHRGLGITMEDFNALIEALQDAMDKNKVAFRAQNRLLALLAPMHRDIVEA